MRNPSMDSYRPQISGILCKFPEFRIFPLKFEEEPKKPMRTLGNLLLL